MVHFDKKTVKRLHVTQLTQLLFQASLTLELIKKAKFAPVIGKVNVL